MKITLFIPCFVDSFYPQTGQAMVRIFEKLGHKLDYKPQLTCCGQPPFNAGYWDESRKVAVKVLDALMDAEKVVIASGSCGAMLKVFYLELFKNTPREADAKALADKTFEFSDFLVNQLGVTDIGAKFPHAVTFHDGCHGLRELGIKTEPRALLAGVEGLELREMGEAQTCCGFGGLFSAKFPQISVAMGQVKTKSATETGTKYLVSNDGSCLMHIQGVLDREKRGIQCLHIAEVLNQGW
ncbi:L-lactate dehydrogenase complex protein LldE [Abditibacterium utsteinense]|uniref:L-lactate dehydrogenase complex protein LldE n=1 Tax=Abditibacterium utsteinense TaxID=1960156 RepID=A0A2S8STU2_9BACT|nr:(Fe-S)-binding protein [Abditibacterium utsteinense]PQV64198.1 L-lactate dehydrogenase complex protein LldE [Abditibacterium utsteinense]